MADPPRDCQDVDPAGNQGRNVAVPQTVERDARQLAGQHEPAPIPAQIVGWKGAVVKVAEDQPIRLGFALPKGHPGLQPAPPMRTQGIHGNRGQGHYTASVFRLRGFEAQTSFGLFKAALDLDGSGIQIDIPQLSASISPRRAPELSAKTAIGSSV
jgi:hypothetical protein